MRKKLGIAFILSVLSLIGGYLLQNSYKFNLCLSDDVTNTYDVSCHELLLRIGDPIFYGMAALSIVFLALLLVPATFNAWKKFAVWSVPLMVIIFTLYKGPGGGFMDPTPYPKQVFLGLSILYVLVSLVVIGYSHHKSKIRK